MANCVHPSFNAAQVADAIFASMLLRSDSVIRSHHASSSPDTVGHIVADIEDGLRMAGLSFAEYLERIRHAQQASVVQAGQRWRFSARERAVQRVNYAVSLLCEVMQQQHAG